jgi:hypothetical protein
MPQLALTAAALITVMASPALAHHTGQSLSTEMSIWLWLGLISALVVQLLTRRRATAVEAQT